MKKPNTESKSIQATKRSLIDAIDNAEPNSHYSEYLFDRLITTPVSDINRDKLRALFNRWGAKRFINSLALNSVNLRMDRKSINAILDLSLGIPAEITEAESILPLCKIAA